MSRKVSDSQTKVLVHPPLACNQDRGGVVYGTEKGTIGHLAVTTKDGTECLRKTWEFSAGVGVGGGDGGRGVTAIASLDLTRDGVEEVVVGHHDGTVTVSLAGTE